MEIKKASIGQKPILERLMQLYLYDFSEMEEMDLDQNGLYEYGRLDSYWKENGRFPFLIYVDGSIAGFVLVNSYTVLRENRKARSIAEFFVLRKYRRQGIGKSAALSVFGRFPGKWEVRQIRSNAAGQQFWRAVIRECTGGRYKETVVDNDLWKGPVQSFDNSR